MASSFKIEIVSIGDRVFPGIYSLHSSFQKVANFLNGEELVTIVTEEVGRGPVNLVVRGLKLSQASSLEIDEDSIIINGETFPFAKGKLYRSRIEADSIDLERLEKNLAVFENDLLELSPPKSLAFLLDPAREANFTTSFEKEFLKRVKNAVRDIVGAASSRDSIGARCPSHNYTSNLIAGIKKLKGLGFGLTPSGDDFNAGLLSALNLRELTSGEDLTELKESVFQTARGNNPLSNSFLALARDGFFFERLKELILSLGGGDEDRVREKAKTLIAHGETSGSDLGVGFLLTM